MSERAHRLLAERHGRVGSQNTWPSLEVRPEGGQQVWSDGSCPPGFYYKTFMKPAALWPKYEHVLAKFAPGGTVDLDTPHGRYDKRYAHPDVVVAGGGPAGLAAAIAAAEAGSSVMLVEHEHQLGGHLCWGSDDDRAAVAELAAAAEAAGVEILTNSTVTGRYEDNWIAISQRSHPGVVERLIKARAKTLVVAAGTIERPYVFEGNDLPGVMTSGAVQRLVRMYRVKPGTQAVVFTANESGDSAVQALKDAGVAIARVVDGRESERIVSASGSKTRVKEVTLHDGAVVPCDLLVTAVGWTTPTSLLNMAGDRPVYDPAAARFFPDGPPDNVLATGGMIGDGTRDELIAHGRATGELAAGRAAVVRHRIQATTARAAAVEGPEHEYPVDERTPLERYRHPELYRSTTPRHRRLLRGRLVEGSLLGRGRGVRFRRADQAVHHRDDGPEPGQARDGQHRRRAGRGPQRDDRRGRHHRVAPALRTDLARRPGRSHQRTEASQRASAVA